MKKLIGFLFSIFLSGFAMAQSSSSDCIGAISICDSVYYEPPAARSPNQVPHEIDSSFVCFTHGEENGRWYRIALADSGTFAFLIQPDDTVDLDWILYDLTGKACDATYTDSDADIACNNSGQISNGGITGLTDSVAGPVFGASITGLANTIYYLYVASSPGDTTGYTIDLRESTVTLADCSGVGTDDESPVSVSAFPNPAQDWIALQGILTSADYRIQTLSGQVVLSGTYEAGKNISVSGLSNGLYILHVLENDRLYSLKWVKLTGN